MIKILLGLVLLAALTEATDAPVSSASPTTDSELEFVGDFTYEEILAKDNGVEDFLIKCTMALATATCTDIQNSVPDCSFTVTIKSDSAAALDAVIADIAANGLTLTALGSYTLYDNVCPSPAPCTDGVDFSGTGNAPCTACATCGSDETATDACTATADTVCGPAPCTDGVNFSGTGNAPCTACATCGSGETATDTCTATADTVCGPTPCTDGVDFSGTGNAPCTPCATCGSGETATDTCTATADTVCAPTTTEAPGTSTVEFLISLVVGENDSLDDIIDVTRKTFAQKYDLPLNRVVAEVVDSNRRRLSTQNVELDVTIMDVTETVANTIVEDVTADEFASEFVTEMESVAVDNAVNISIDDVFVTDAPLISVSGDTTSTEEVKDDSGSDSKTGLIVAIVVIVVVVFVLVGVVVWHMTKDEELKADSDNKYTNTQMTSSSSSKGIRHASVKRTPERNSGATPEDEEVLEIYNPTPETEVPVSRSTEDGQEVDYKGVVISTDI